MCFLFCRAIEQLNFKLMSSVFAYIGRNSLILLCFHAIIYRYYDYLTEKCNITIDPYIKVLFSVLIIIIVKHVIEIRKKLVYSKNC